MEGTALARRFDHTKIKRFRSRTKLTQYKVSQLAGISLDTYRDYEQGRVTPSVERLFMIADVLGCKLDDFAADTENENKGNACSQTITARS